MRHRPALACVVALAVSGLVVPAAAAAGGSTPDPTPDQRTSKLAAERQASSGLTVRHLPTGRTAPGGHGGGTDLATWDRKAAGERLRSALKGGPAAPTGDVTRLVVRGTDVAAATKAAGSVTDQGARLAARLGALKGASVEVPADRAEQVAAELRRQPGVVSVTQAHRMSLAMVPNDPMYAADQAPYFTTLDAPAAWDLSSGSGTKVAVVDSGVDVTRPDLTGKVVAQYNSSDGSTDVTDTVGHGTAVASVAAAVSDDAAGMAGAARAADVIAVKIADASGAIWSDAAANGIVWAATHGADVINLSWGSTTDDSLVRQAVATAQSDGAVVVAAAGNGDPSTGVGWSVQGFPAALPGVVAVGATTQDGASKTSFSSYGSWVDVAAPGADITVAVPPALDTDDGVVDGWTRWSGTSFSSPLVAGEAALIRSRNPLLTAGQVAQVLVTAHDGQALGFAGGNVDFAKAVKAVAAPTAPVITAPASGDSVTGAPTVSAQSAASQVRFSVPGTSLAVTAPVVGGVATAQLPTYGLGGTQTIQATACGDSVCASDPATVQVVVSNDPPVVAAPATVGTTLTMTATETAVGGAVRFLVDGVTRATDTSAPFAATMDTTPLVDGPHTLTAVRCDASGTTCDTANPSQPVTFSVLRLRPKVAVWPPAFSPNGDGLRDVATVTYTLEQPQTADLRVINSSGTVMRSLRLGTNLSAGTRSWAWNGKSNSGYGVADGLYRIELRTSTVKSGVTVYGIATTSTRVDRVKASLWGLSSSPTTVYPVKDGYADSTRLAVSTNENLAALEVRITNGYGTRIKTMYLGSQPWGARTAWWDGRTASGAVPAAGTYYVQWVATDNAGNVSYSGKSAVAVSTKKLVSRSASATVGAYDSAAGTAIGSCSSVFHPGRAAWTTSLGYYSNYDCYTGLDDGTDLASVLHHYTLPWAVKYGYVKVSAYGGTATSVTQDSAALIYYDSTGTLSNAGVTLAPTDGLYTGPVGSAATYLSGRTLSWLVGTTSYNWYDVRSFTVTWTYYVLA